MYQQQLGQPVIALDYAFISICFEMHGFCNHVIYENISKCISLETNTFSCCKYTCVSNAMKGLKFIKDNIV